MLYLYRDGSTACNPGDSPTEGTQKKTGVDVDDEARLEVFGIKW